MCKFHFSETFLKNKKKKSNEPRLEDDLNSLVILFEINRRTIRHPGRGFTRCKRTSLDLKECQFHSYHYKGKA